MNHSPLLCREISPNSGIKWWWTDANCWATPLLTLQSVLISTNFLLWRNFLCSVMRSPNYFSEWSYGTRSEYWKGLSFIWGKSRPGPRKSRYSSSPDENSGSGETFELINSKFLSSKFFLGLFGASTSPFTISIYYFLGLCPSFLSPS